MTKKHTGFTLLEVLIYSTCVMMMVPLLHSALRIVLRTYTHIRQERQAILYHYTALEHILDDIFAAHSWQQNNDRLLLHGIGWHITYHTRADGLYRRRERIKNGRHIVSSTFCAPTIKKITATMHDDSHVLIQYNVDDVMVWYRVACLSQEW